MGFSFIKKFFGQIEENSSDVLWIYSQCDKCGEKFRTLVRKKSELTPTYKNEEPSFFIKKELIGSSCPNRIKLHITFNRNYKKISENISGGHFISKENYMK